jgi:hypothetical protein
MAMLSKESLLARTLPQQDVDLADGTVRVRALSRTEAVHVATFGNDVNAAEVFIITCALIEPQLTEDEVRGWRDVAPTGEIDAVANTVLELSGLTPAAAEAALHRFPLGP